MSDTPTSNTPDEETAQPVWLLTDAIQHAYEALQEGDYEVSELIARAILADYPELDGVLQILGTALGAQGLYEEAIQYCESAVTLSPDSCHHKNTLANYLVEVGDWTRAEALYREAIALNPNVPDATYNLAKLLLQKGEFDTAETLFQQLLILSPNTPGIYQNIGACHFNRAKYQSAIQWFKLALAMDATDPDLLNSLALTYQELGKPNEALEAFTGVLALNPNRYDVLLGMAKAHYARKDLTRSEQMLRAFLEHSQDSTEEGEMMLTGVLKAQGKLSEAIEAHKALMEKYPQSSIIVNNMLLDMVYSDEISQQELFNYHLEFSKRFEAAHLASHPKHTNTRDPQRKLRIAYVSADFFNHSVAYYSLPLIARHDKQRFDVFCYYNRKEETPTTKLFQQVAHFKHVDGLSNQAFCDLVTQDQIDILIDLSGHTGGNRLTAFARKPAPVQISWLGYPFSTGLKSMDYRIVDKIVEPKGLTEHINTEQLIRLEGCFLAYRPSIAYPHRITNGELDIRETPAKKNGYVTFGSCNNIAKLTDATLTLWAKILAAIPNAKLLVETVDTENANVQASLRERFEPCGISMDSVVLSNRAKNQQYALYHEMDIALDPFPCNGGTTTSDALWMSVPVVSIVGDRFMSRMGETFLRNVGHPEWLAQTEEEYIAIAVKLAADIEQLDEIRQNLRGEVEESPLMDEVGFTRRMETAYQQAWATWCNKEETGQVHDNPEHFFNQATPTVAAKPFTPLVHLDEASERTLKVLHHYEHAEWADLVAETRTQLENAPEQHGIRHLLGLAYLAQNNLEQALPCLLRCTQEAPTEAAYHNSLGNAYLRANQLDAAINSYRLATRYQPTLAEAHFNLGVCLSTQGQALSLASTTTNDLLEEATAAYQTVLTLLPQHAVAWNNLGTVLLYRNRPQEAEIAFRRALKYDPNQPEALVNQATLSHKQGKTVEAITLTEKALQIQPNHPNALNNLASYYGQSGNAAKAQTLAHQATLLDPSNPNWRDTELLMQIYSSTTDEVRKATAMAYADVVESALPDGTVQPHFNTPNPTKKLKIGYVSGDFHHHSAAYTTEALFSLHDHTQFEVYFYYNGDKYDAITQRYQGRYADQWRNIRGVSAEIVEALVREDGIDILLDLAGHTLFNSLPTFARKPAPVQVSWLGYPDTTGLTAMDYRITDTVGDPVHFADRTYYSEKLWRLDTPFCVYRPYVAHPEYEPMVPYQVRPTPALAAGYITFGSVSSLARLTPYTIGLWSRVLQAVPTAKLFLEAPTLGEPSVIARVQADFAEYGITADRLLLYPRNFSQQYQVYHNIDIALDAFPSNGGITSLDTLWMGVPLVSRAGHRFASRIGASFLTHLGHPEWVAHDDESFVEKAVALAQDIDALNALRQSLRAEMKASPLMDGVRFTRGFEAALRGMWVAWCASDAAATAREYDEMTETLALCGNLVAEGNYPEAWAGYTALLKRWPKHAEALYGLGLTGLLQGNASAARPLLERAAEALHAENYPVDLQADCLATLGNACLQLEDNTAAMLHLRHSLALKNAPNVREWLESIPNASYQIN